jgi:hypothetical protein
MSGVYGCGRSFITGKSGNYQIEELTLSVTSFTTGKFSNQLSPRSLIASVLAD